MKDFKAKEVLLEGLERECEQLRLDLGRERSVMLANAEDDGGVRSSSEAKKGIAPSALALPSRSLYLCHRCSFACPNLPDPSPPLMPWPACGVEAHSLLSLRNETIQLHGVGNEGTG